MIFKQYYIKFCFNIFYMLRASFDQKLSKCSPTQKKTSSPLRKGSIPSTTEISPTLPRKFFVKQNFSKNKNIGNFNEKSSEKSVISPFHSMNLTSWKPKLKYLFSLFRLHGLNKATQINKINLTWPI